MPALPALALALLTTSTSSSPTPSSTPSTTTPSSTPSSTAPSSAAPSAWITGAAAPTSTSTTPVTLPPATAPRTPGAADEVLVVPPEPPEDARVVKDAAPVVAPDARRSTGFSRNDRLESAALDVESFVDRALVPGVVFVSRGPGLVVPATRGHRSSEVGVIVDGVPLLRTSFSEAFSLLGDAQLQFERGPRADSLAASGLGGVIDIDSGGALDDLGETGRVDGTFGAGYGGPDNEKGAFFLARTGWRTLRLVAHGTALQREDFRTGRLGLDVPPGVDRVDPGSQIVVGSGGLGGTLGARVDVVPVEGSRVFVSHHAGRSLDAGDPVSCSARNADGNATDCTRARERGVDVVVAGGDLRAQAFGLTLTPRVRIHAQRTVNDRVRFGSALTDVETATDNVLRGGAVLGVDAASDKDAVVVDAGASVSIVADRYDSQFSRRSLLVRDGEPAGGLAVPADASFVDDATAHNVTGVAHLGYRDDFVAVHGAVRVVAADIHADAVAGRNEAIDTNDIIPGGEASAVVHVARTDHIAADVSVAFGHAARARDVDVVLQSTDGADASAPAADDFGEVGVHVDGGFVDVDVVGWGSVRSAPDTGVVHGAVRAAGVEGALGLRPTPELSARLVASGLIADDDAGPVGGVLQPQLGGIVRYAPTAWPVVFYARAQGGLPQTRLSVEEAASPRLCPELSTDEAVPQTAPCSGVAGFAVVDVGAALTLGQLRIDVVGENLTDTQGAWRGAVLGTGGASVRTRVAFVF